MGAVLGPSFFANVYQSTNTLPNVVYQFLTGALFASLLVPPLVRVLDRRDTAAAGRLAGGFLGVVLVSFLAAAVALVAAGPLVLRLLGLGVDDAVIAADQQRVGMLLLALVMPQLLFYGIAGTAAAAMNARGRFALAAAAPALENLGIVTTLGVFAAMGASGRQIGDVSTTEVLVLGCGTTAAVGVHAAAQVWGSHRVGIRLRPRAGWRDPDVCQALRAARPAVGQSGLAAVSALGALVVAGSIPGGVVAYLLALSFLNLITALTARPMATALLPRLSRMHDAGDGEGLRAELDRSLALVAVLAIPAALCLLALAEPLSWAVTFGDMATMQGENLVAVALSTISLAVFAEATFIVLTAISYARGEPGAPFRAMLLRTSLTLLGYVLTLVFADGIFVLVGLGLSIAIGTGASALQLGRAVLRPLPGGTARLRPVVLRAALVGTFIGVAGLAAGHLAHTLLEGGTADVLAGLAACAVAAATFLVAHRLLKSPDLAGFRNQLPRFRSLPRICRRRSP